jgi:hypothetical protein
MVQLHCFSSTKVGITETVPRPRSLWDQHSMLVGVGPNSEVRTSALSVLMTTSGELRPLYEVKRAEYKEL